MRLTPELVARVDRLMPDPGPYADAVLADDSYRRGVIDCLLGALEPGADIWLFVYGSLMWKPAYKHAEERVAVLHGWHRAFCLGWDERYRGHAGKPGLMMALDRGGSCRGIAHRMPQETCRDELMSLFRREMPFVGEAFPARLVTVTTERGPLRAITFVINRKGGRYVGGLTPDQVADSLAVATGMWGSMAAYLHSTVRSLEAFGIHDSHLWRLQELVAERIERAALPPNS